MSKLSAVPQEGDSPESGSNDTSQVEDATTVEQEVYSVLKKVFLLLDDCDRHFFTEYGLSSRMFWALQALDEVQGRAMVDLSRILFTDKSNVTGIVDNLEKASLATRTPASHDRRVILVKLTPEGRRKRDFVKAQHDIRTRDLLGALSDDNLHTLLGILDPLGRNLETYLEQVTSNGLSLPSYGESDDE
ncbi:MAG: MarR family winged helix-turn-helix transcriptional regulator [Ktedonobacterales bacterium]